ncbi:hypothetical protein MPLB_950033 [Mesorhizobium sp. ORS 3324]|nr:hypothetical protein MPLB_950033 [Mesorhizobium sp. ORS 3324]
MPEPGWACIAIMPRRSRPCHREAEAERNIKAAAAACCLLSLRILAALLKALEGGHVEGCRGPNRRKKRLELVGKPYECDRHHGLFGRMAQVGLFGLGASQIRCP